MNSESDYEEWLDWYVLCVIEKFLLCFQELEETNTLEIIKYKKKLQRSGRHDLSAMGLSYPWILIFSENYDMAKQ